MNVDFLTSFKRFVTKNCSEALADANEVSVFGFSKGFAISFEDPAYFYFSGWDIDSFAKSNVLY